MELFEVSKIISKNLNAFLENTGRTPQWIISRSGIPKSTYYKLLKGEGDLEKHLGKIIDLFGIEDPFYFHNVNFKLGKKFNSDITEHIAANYVQVEGEQEAFNETLTMINDFVHMIETLKKNDPENNDTHMHLLK